MIKKWMNDEKMVSYVLLGLTFVSFLIGLIAGLVTATTPPPDSPFWIQKYDDEIIAVSFLIPWLASMVFAFVYWFQKSSSRKTKS